MNSTFKIKKTVLEKQLQNLNINDLEHVLEDMNQSFAIDLLSVDKNIKLLTKKSDFEFLSKVFDKIKNLSSGKSNFQFLNISNEYFSQIIYQKSFDNINPFSKLQNFVTQAMDLAISHKKRHNTKDIFKVMSIGKNFNIEQKKIVNWIGKITAYSKDTSILDCNKKLSLLQDKQLRERYISLIINISQETKFLDYFFNLYEPQIYDLYAQYKGNETTWNCLLPKNSWTNYKYLPYIDEQKLNWLESKNIGYRNNPVYFELYQLENSFNQSQYSEYFKTEFNEKISNEYYQNIIYNSLIDYHKNFLPKKNEAFQSYINNPENESKSEKFIYSEEYKTLNDLIKKSPIISILSVYDKNPAFYEYCKKLKLKVALEDKLVPENKKDKKIKI